MSIEANAHVAATTSASAELHLAVATSASVNAAEGIKATGTGEAGACPNAQIALTPAEQEILREDVPALARTVRDPAARERYAALAEAIDGGVVPSELLFSLEAMLELVLQTKAVRRRHGPDAERVISDLFYRTGRGVALRQAARDVNRALEALVGQTIERIAVTAGAGRHSIAVQTDRASLTLVVDGGGVRVERVEVGG